MVRCPPAEPRFAKRCLGTATNVPAVTVTSEYQVDHFVANLFPAQTVQLMPQVAEDRIRQLNKGVRGRRHFAEVDQHQIAIDESSGEAPGDFVEHGHGHLALGQAGEEMLIGLGVEAVVDPDVSRLGVTGQIRGVGLESVQQRGGESARSGTGPARRSARIEQVDPYVSRRST